jgi:hypothetical protein
MTVIVLVATIERPGRGVAQALEKKRIMQTNR